MLNKLAQRTAHTTSVSTVGYTRYNQYLQRTVWIIIPSLAQISLNESDGLFTMCQVVRAACLNKLLSRNDVETFS